ncbi:MAG: ABC transporter substrate-binding protein [Firmicutes bacterium]|nr:ABC transporter substrate-binding protein [Bacillota bacterium]
MFNHKLGRTVVALLLFALMFTACAPEDQDEYLEQQTQRIQEPAADTTARTAPEPTTTSAQAYIQEQIEASMAEPTEEHTGGVWVDQVFFVAGDKSNELANLIAGKIDIGSWSSNPYLFTEVKNNPDLKYFTKVSSNFEIAFNTAGPTFEDGRINPFSNARIREAANMLVDREYIANEIKAGLALPKYTALHPNSEGYALASQKIKELVLKYAYNPDRAKEIVAEEMVLMGAELIDGIWHYDGTPVEIIIISRGNDEREDIGNYFAEQLKTIGFKAVTNHTQDATMIWMNSQQSLGQWHAYVGGWASTSSVRSSMYVFVQMYTDRSASFSRQAHDPLPEFVNIADALYHRTYTSQEERIALLERALELSFEDSSRIFLIDSLMFIPMRADISVTTDILDSTAGMWHWTLRKGDQIGGSVIISLDQIAVDPWNPVGGSNWTYDNIPARLTFDRGIVQDPATELYRNHWIEKAEVTVLEGLPVTKTDDWVSLEFADEILVPADAWYNWDPVEQRFLTAGEVFPEGVTVKRKSVIYYDQDLFKTAKWHDGSPYTIGDILCSYIHSFDRLHQESPYYDSTTRNVSMPTSFIRIISEDPFIYEYYTDAWETDAELNIHDLSAALQMGKAPWHILALGLLGEESGKLAFSLNKAMQTGAEWIGFESGAAPAIMAEYLDRASAENFLPWPDFLGKYISKEEIQARYANAKAWYEAKGHFQIGDGPLYLEKIIPGELIHFKRFKDYPKQAGTLRFLD